MSEAEGEPTPEQLLAELRKTKVSDFLVHTSSIVASLGYGKLDASVRDLDEARLAIDALKALEPLLPDEQRRELADVLANLQLAYADAAKSS